MRLITYLLIITLISLLFSCSQHKHISKGSFLQKKKYSSGFNIILKKKIPKSTLSNSAFTSTHDEPLDSTRQDLVSSYSTELLEDKYSKNDEPIYKSRKENTLEKESNSSVKTYKPSSRPSLIEPKNLRNYKINLTSRKLVRFEGSAVNEEGSFIFYYILCVVGLSPLGVLLGIGAGEQFKINLFSWLAGMSFIVAIFILPVAQASPISFLVFGSLCFIYAAVHGILLLSRY